jgi:NitT/TauT family transport system permease protein
VNTVQGTQAIDRRLFSMMQLYQVSWFSGLTKVVLPGIQSFSAAAISYALGISWKVATTVEFIGSTRGAGAQIYWAYRGLDMPRLFSWGILIISLGLVVDHFVAGPLRKRSVAWQGGGHVSP